jgi:predicted ArsR family transcriptional regulator
VCKAVHDVDLPPASDDVLGQPTRARLFALLADLKRPTATEELARRLDLHPNGVRAHLERLRAAGLVCRTQSTARVGRPRHEWTVAPGAHPAGEPPSAYRELVRWLVRASPAGPRRLREVEATGREIGREIAPPSDRATAPALQAALAALGFEPRVEDRGHSVDCRLGNCPYRDAVRENQPLVCSLHRGITLGMLDTIDPGAELTEFAPRDPDEAGCRIQVRLGTPAAA